MIVSESCRPSRLRHSSSVQRQMTSSRAEVGMMELDRSISTICRGLDNRDRGRRKNWMMPSITISSLWCRGIKWTSSLDLHRLREPKASVFQGIRKSDHPSYSPCASEAQLFQEGARAAQSADASPQHVLQSQICVGQPLQIHTVPQRVIKPVTRARVKGCHGGKHYRGLQ